MAIPGLPGGLIIYQGHLFPLKGHLCLCVCVCVSFLGGGYDVDTVLQKEVFATENKFLNNSYPENRGYLE